MAGMSMRPKGSTASRAAAAWLALAGFPLTLGSQSFTATSGMPVRIEIVASCDVSASDLDFGAYDTASATPTLGQTTVQLLCSAGAVVDISLDGGTGSSGNTQQRKLAPEAGGADRLDYGLFQDAARSVHWGDRPGKDTREVLASGAQQTVPVYGQIRPGQQVASGTYADVITVQLQF